MKKIATICLEDVKTMLRRGTPVQLSNYGGWCVAVIGKEAPRYVIDQERGGQPVAYKAVGSLQQVRPDISMYPYTAH